MDVRISKNIQKKLSDGEINKNELMKALDWSQNIAEFALIGHIINAVTRDQEAM